MDARKSRHACRDAQPTSLRQSRTVDSHVRAFKYMTDWSVYEQNRHKYRWNYQWATLSRSRRASRQARTDRGCSTEALRARAVPGSHDGSRSADRRGRQRNALSLLPVQGRALPRRFERRTRHRISHLPKQHRSKAAGGREVAAFDRVDGGVLRSAARFSSVLRKRGTEAGRGAQSDYRDLARPRFQFFRGAGRRRNPHRRVPADRSAPRVIDDPWRDSIAAVVLRSRPAGL